VSLNYNLLSPIFKLQTQSDDKLRISLYKLTAASRQPTLYALRVRAQQFVYLYIWHISLH